MATAMTEPGSRFAHLLQPLKDLSKVWNIEIADELNQYIEEIEQLAVTDPEAGILHLNFKEAALLIQGSTAIYSRKVEQLHQLCYQALDMLAARSETNGKKANKAGHVPQQSGLWAPIPETEDLLTVDHLIKEGRNIQLDANSASTSRQAFQRRVPLFLMPREKSDSRKRDFRISSCTVHPSGVYLLQESDAKLVDELLAVSADTTSPGRSGVSGFLQAPLQEVQDLDLRLQALLQDCRKEGEDDGTALGDPPMENTVTSSTGVSDIGTADVDEVKFENTFQPVVDIGNEHFLGTSEGEGRPSLARKSNGLDPWELLDEHEIVGKEVPLEVGNTSRRVEGLKPMLNGARALLPVASRDRAVSDESLWSGNNGSTAYSLGALPMLAIGNPVESLYLSLASRFKHGSRLEAQKAGFSAAWFEFEDLFIPAAARHRARRAERRVGLPNPVEFLDRPAPPTPDASFGCGNGVDGDLVDDGTTTPPRSAACTQLVNALELSEEKQRLSAEQRAEVSVLENQIQEAQQKYEATVRRHLQLLQQDGAHSDVSSFPELYANVQQWQEQLAPVLKAYETRPEFDIDTHSSILLQELSENCDTEVEAAGIPFAALVEGQPRWEVCRRFLTCLQLTNQGNTDIECIAEKDRLNTFKVRLVSQERKPKRLLCAGTDELPLVSRMSEDASTGRPKKILKRPRGRESS